jgi:hypothetical protein
MLLPLLPKKLAVASHNFIDPDFTVAQTPTDLLLFGCDFVNPNPNKPINIWGNSALLYLS